MSKTDLENYDPSTEQLNQLGLLLDISSECFKQGIPVWVFGGYGMDALYGKLTRDHRDFDLYTEQKSEDRFIDIIKTLDFYPTSEKVGKAEKAVYRNDGFSPDFKLEYGIAEKIMELVSEEKRELFFPKKPLEILRNHPILTPTVEGFKRIIEINDQLAASEGWTEYPYREWQREIMSVLING